MTPMTIPGRSAFVCRNSPRRLHTGTGVEDDHVGRVAVGRFFVALGAQLAQHELAVEHVHLAAEGFQVQLFHGAGRIVA
jgi:hypothetical protein